MKLHIAQSLLKSLRPTWGKSVLVATFACTSCSVKFSVEAPSSKAEVQKLAPEMLAPAAVVPPKELLAPEEDEATESFTEEEEVRPPVLRVEPRILPTPTKVVETEGPLDEIFDADTLPTTGAPSGLEQGDPLTEIVDAALEIDSTELVALDVADGENVALPPRERDLGWVYGEFQRNHFEDLKADLAYHRKAVQRFPVRPEPVVETAVVAKNVITQPAPNEVGAETLVQIPVQPRVYERPDVASSSPAVAVASVTPPPAPSAPTQQISRQVWVALLKELGNGAAAARAVANPEKRLVVQRSSSETAASDLEHLYTERTGATIVGTFSMAREVEEDLQRYGGYHVELRLEPVDRWDRQGQDTRFIPYKFPNESFYIDGRKLKGAYRLHAGLYVKGRLSPVADILYHEKPGTLGVISADTRRVTFDVDATTYRAAQTKAHNGQKDGLFISGTVFQVALENQKTPQVSYKKPKAVPGARIEVVGFPEWGVAYANSEGNFHFPPEDKKDFIEIPARSDVTIRVQAPGLYPTYKVVPIFNASAYAPTYLLSEKDVQGISDEITHNPQDPEKGLVFARVFDTATREPLAGETVNLSFRRGKGVYVDYMRDRWRELTSRTGLVGFLNVIPSMRALTRAQPNKRAPLFQVWPKSATYVELGRSGERRFRGRVIDPFNPDFPLATVRLVMDPSSEVTTNLDGQFEMKLDFSPDVLTFEVQAEGYPPMLFNVPYDPQEPDTERKFYLMDQQKLKRAIFNARNVKLDETKGIVIGGAETSFFTADSGCVTAELVDLSGTPIAPEQGPFSIDEGLTSEKVCLTEQRPSFGFFNLKDGSYQLKLYNADRKLLRTHLVRVGAPLGIQPRVTISVN